MLALFRFETQESVKYSDACLCKQFGELGGDLVQWSSVFIAKAGKEIRRLSGIRPPSSMDFNGDQVAILLATGSVVHIYRQILPLAR